MAETRMSKQEVLDQLKKNGVTDLDSFAELVVKKAQAKEAGTGPVVASFVAIDHGIVSH
jgi:hypothetical protein